MQGLILGMLCLLGHGLTLDVNSKGKSFNALQARHSNSEFDDFLDVVTDLPYKKDALKPHMSAETIEFHYEKHHKGYAAKLNELAAADKSLRGGYYFINMIHLVASYRTLRSTPSCNIYIGQSLEDLIKSSHGRVSRLTSVHSDKDKSMSLLLKL